MIQAILVSTLILSFLLQGCSFSSPEREIKVLETKYESVQGMDINTSDFSIATHYNYDDTGKLVSTSQSTEIPNSNFNLSKSSFDYDDQGRISKVSTAYEQYGWNVGNTEEFQYDDSGNCSSYTYTVVSEGTGTQQYTYKYGPTGLVDTGLLTSYLGPQDIEGTTSLSWVYRDNGLIESVSSSGLLGFVIDEGLSNEELQAYCYKDKYNTTTVLYFDDTGLLTGIDTTSPDGTSRTKYEYRTIVVDSREYTPTVYSNPSGFDIQWKPQYSEQEISTILNR